VLYNCENAILFYFTFFFWHVFHGAAAGLFETKLSNDSDHYGHTHFTIQHNTIAIYCTKGSHNSHDNLLFKKVISSASYKTLFIAQSYETGELPTNVAFPFRNVVSCAVASWERGAKLSMPVYRRVIFYV
jgi:hypothetical protein